MDDASTHPIVARLKETFGDGVVESHAHRGDATAVVTAACYRDAVKFLRDDPECRFTQLMDICGVDYPKRAQRFDVVYHLLSLNLNQRIRVKIATDEKTSVPSITDLFPVANWHERETFDLFGVLFDGHPDLRRILTDYGFIGHPFRKDFPLIGNVEVAYDAEKGRVAYQPVSIEPRTLVPRVIRDDNRYSTDLKDSADG